MRLVLDTNTYRLVMEGAPEAAGHVRIADVVMLPVPVIAELRYGFMNGNKGQRNEATLSRFLDQPRVEVLVCDEGTASEFARLKLQLKRQGTPIPINDVWIAALTVQHRGTLYTRDTDFDRLPQLPRI